MTGGPGPEEENGESQPEENQEEGDPENNPVMNFFKTLVSDTISDILVRCARACY